MARRREIGGLSGDTLPQLFWNGVQARGESVMFREKDLGIWRAMTWAQAGEQVKHTGLGLVSLGFEPGECACILSNTNKEWVVADLGILGAAGVSAGIYPTDAEAQVEFLLNDSGSKTLFVEGEEQLDKALAVRERTPHLKRIVVFDMEGLRDFADPMVMSFAELRAAGEEFERSHPEVWEQRIAVRRPEDLAILVYTSGTTGPPKGAMISHRNIVFQCREGAKLLPTYEGDNRLAFLPLCHVAERVIGLYYAIYTGTINNFAESPETVPENAREIAPDALGAVPRIWEKFYSAVNIALQDATPLQKWAYRLAIGVGYRVADRRIARQPVPLGLRLLDRLGYWLVLKNIRKGIGIDRCRWLVTGAAPISPELIRWYLALGCDMLEVYGQTENTGLATIMAPGEIKLGTVGKCVPYGEMRVSPEGELLIRGEHVFMGYYNDPEKTAETIKDGWLHTGDLGEIDAERYVRVTDRMKDVIITAGGKNVTPSEIENQLKFSPYITDAVVIGDRRKYLTCLVMIDHENVVKFAQDRNVPFTNFASLCRAKEVNDLIGEEVEKVNRNFARVEGIKKFRLIDRQLTPEDEELTPTMKLKRKLVSEKYAPLIDSMYAAEKAG